jgi:isopentenyl diphosphate isomerase/L-lactate dehydrogenase-like FMN-dependent dehydrogenase
MDERVTSRAVTFVRPLSLNGIDGELAAGSYTIEMVEEPTAGLSFLAYRRVSTAIVLSANAGRSRQIVTIDAQDLAAAEARDASSMKGTR